MGTFDLQYTFAAAHQKPCAALYHRTTITNPCTTITNFRRQYEPIW